MSSITAKALGFRETGFGGVTRKVEISVWLVARPTFTPSWGVHLFHGQPGGKFWRNEAPLVECDTLEEAKAVAERLFGVAGSGEYANIVNPLAR